MTAEGGLMLRLYMNIDDVVAIFGEESHAFSVELCSVYQFTCEA